MVHYTSLLYSTSTPNASAVRSIADEKSSRSSLRHFALVITPLAFSNSPASVYCTSPARVCTCMHIGDELGSSSANDIASASPGRILATWLDRGRAPNPRQQAPVLPVCTAISTGLLLTINAASGYTPLRFLVMSSTKGLSHPPHVFIYKYNFKYPSNTCLLRL